MKKIVEYKYGVTDYNVGDVVYLNYKKGKPTCRARALYEDNGKWTFKPMRKILFMKDEDGNIPFYGIPCIFAKEIEIKEDQP